MRVVVRTLHYSIRTEDAYVDWARRYILFHNKMHPALLGAPHVESGQASFRTRFSACPDLCGSFPSIALGKHCGFPRLEKGWVSRNSRQANSASELISVQESISQN